MKKILSLFVLALLSSQMWAAYSTTVTISGKGQVSLSSSTGYANSITATGSYSYTTVNIYAKANSGYVFKGWGATANATSYISTASPYSLKPSSYSNKTIYAIFAPEDKSVTVTQNGSGGTTNWASTSIPSGYVDLGLPSGLLWASSDLDGYYKWNTSTPTTSYGSSGYTYSTSWTNTPTAITTEGVRLPTADEFSELINLSNTNTSVSSGTLTVKNKSNSSISITFTKQGNYATSTKDNNSTYWWSSTYNSGTGTSAKAKGLQVTSSSKSVSTSINEYYACKIRTVYEPQYKTLTIKAGTATYVYKCVIGQKVTVTPSPASGYTFSSWSKTSGTTLTMSGNTFTVTADATYTANFVSSNITISAASAGNGTGQVSTTNGSGYTSSVSVTPGTTVYLKATPSSEDYVFDYWTNNQNSSRIETATASVNPTVATTYTAHFAEAAHSYTITVSVASGCESMGTVSGGGADLEANSETTIRATANLGYRFVSWNDGVTDAVRVVTVTNDRTYTATFAELPLKTTTIAQDGTGRGIYDMVKYSDDYVKLGNVYWATKNVGATYPYETGNYYAWGETTTKSDYSAGTYTYTSQTVIPNSDSPYDNHLPSAADAATAVLGSDWRMPTYDELSAFVYGFNWEAGTLSGREGYVGTKDGKSIFIPKTGYKDGTNSYGSLAFYTWSSSLTSATDGTYRIPISAKIYLPEGQSAVSAMCYMTNQIDNHAPMGMPIRPVYVGTVPTIPTCTLTVNANGHTYTYIVVNGQQLTVTVNPQEHYRFAGWTKTSGTALSVSDNTFTITGDATYTANFEPITYTITVNSFEGNGKVVITSQGESQEIGKTGGSVTLGENVNVTIQAVPDARNRFISWTCDPVVDTDDVDGASIDIRTLQGNRTFTPTFESNVAMVLADTENEAYYSSLYNDAQYAGKVLTVTMTGRRLAEGSWMTFCAPFDFPIPAGHPMYGSVYRFVNGTMSGTNTEGYISLDFRRTYEIEANVPYLVVAGVTTDSDLEFDCVTIDAEPTQTPVEASSHHVQFVSQPWKSTLTNDALTMEDFYIASGNMLRYANPTTGTTIRAFRAYFHRLVDLGSAPRRMIISLDGVETTKEIGIDGEIEDMTTKRMENGVLYIERNGVRYDAQGQRAE